MQVAQITLLDDWWFGLEEESDTYITYKAATMSCNTSGYIGDATRRRMCWKFVYIIFGD